MGSSPASMDTFSMRHPGVGEGGRHEDAVGADGQAVVAGVLVRLGSGGAAEASRAGGVDGAGVVGGTVLDPHRVDEGVVAQERALLQARERHRVLGLREHAVARPDALLEVEGATEPEADGARPARRRDRRSGSGRPPSPARGRSGGRTRSPCPGTRRRAEPRPRPTASRGRDRPRRGSDVSGIAGRRPGPARGT
jgi:hypothetical protein